MTLVDRGLRVVVVEQDVYSLEAIVGYLSWDRRTRVLAGVETLHELYSAFTRLSACERIDVVLLDTSFVGTPDQLSGLIDRVKTASRGSSVVCLAHAPEPQMCLTARDAGACAYLSRRYVRDGLAHALDLAMDRHFTVTADLYNLILQRDPALLSRIYVLPNRRHYAHLTDRIEQTLQLCVIKGLPAELAAEEMGLSVNTVRSYLKEAYRILELHDDTIYPDNVSPAERAFLRYTALDAVTVESPWLPAT